ncbi:MAG: molecular chaperone Hsp20 [Acidobacteria bacterium]|nr:MAG: molecular chaperone Hsp20 [Acidobacteriota bacterium]
MKMLKRLLPWNWRNRLPVRWERDTIGLFTGFDRIFEDFFTGMGEFPSVSMSERDKDVVIEARLPRMTRKDIDLSISDGALTIRAERREGKEKTRRAFYSFQGSVSMLHKTIPLPEGIDMDRIEARFKRGVLRVILPKTAEARERVRRIPVTVEA